MLGDRSHEVLEGGEPHLDRHASRHVGVLSTSQIRGASLLFKEHQEFEPGDPRLGGDSGLHRQCVDESPYLQVGTCGAVAKLPRPVSETEHVHLSA